MEEKELLQLKKQIEEAKGKVSELQGRRKYLLQELSDKWGCKSVEEAYAKIEEMKKEVEELNNRIDQEIRSLKNDYDL